MELIPILSIVFAIISITLTILTKYTQKKIIRNSETFYIHFDIKGKDITPKLSRRTKEIKSEIALLLEVPESVMDILKPRVIRQGLRFEICLFINDTNNKDIDFKTIINNAVENGELESIMLSGWNLKALIQIENVKCEGYNNHKETQMSYIAVQPNDNEDEVDSINTRAAIHRSVDTTNLQSIYDQVMDTEQDDSDDCNE